MLQMSSLRVDRFPLRPIYLDSVLQWKGACMSKHLVCLGLVDSSKKSFRTLELVKHSVLASLAFIMLCFLAVGVGAQSPTPVPSPTWRYDITHQGQNTQETALTPANVNVNSFGKLFSLGVDSTVYAQPLYLPGLKMGDGQLHNVVFVATENDSIYAFDADSNGGSDASPIWKITLLDAARRRYLPIRKGSRLKGTSVLQSALLAHLSSTQRQIRCTLWATRLRVAPISRGYTRSIFSPERSSRVPPCKRLPWLFRPL